MKPNSKLKQNKFSKINNINQTEESFYVEMCYCYL